MNTTTILGRVMETNKTLQFTDEQLDVIRLACSNYSVRCNKLRKKALLNEDIDCANMWRSCSDISWELYRLISEFLDK